MQAIQNRLKDPFFCTDIAMRYHSRRWAFIHRVEFWTLFLSFFLPFTVFLRPSLLVSVEDGVVKYPLWFLVGTMAYVLVWLIVEGITAKEDPWTRTKYSRRHRDAKRLFGTIEQQFLFAKDTGELDAAVRELSRALREYPLRLPTLRALAYNECLRARGEQGEIPMRFRQRLFANWF